MAKRAKLASKEWERCAGQLQEALDLTLELQKHTAEQRNLLNLSPMHQDMNLRRMALAMAGNNDDRATELLLHAAESIAPYKRKRTSGPLFNRWGGQVESYHNLNCPFDKYHLEDARDELVPIYEHEQDDPFWSTETSPFLSEGTGILWGSSARVFGHDACEALMGLRPMSQKDNDRFARVSVLQRKFHLMLQRTVADPSLRVDHVSILRQREDVGCLDRHFDSDKRLQCAILVLAIYDCTEHDWCDHISPEVPCGVDVFDFYSGDREDQADAFSVRCPLNHVGDCMILRGAHFANKTVKPPPGFEVYKYVVWFETSPAPR